MAEPDGTTERSRMKRVRVLGDLYHGRIPEGAIYIGRKCPGLPESPFHNPYRVKIYGVDALRLFALYLDHRPELVERARRELAGHDLACWCKESAKCHGDEWIRRIEGAP